MICQNAVFATVYSSPGASMTSTYPIVFSRAPNDTQKVLIRNDLFTSSVFRNTEDVNRSFRISTFWVSLGALLNTIGYVLVMEAPGDEYTVAKTAFWQIMHSLRSNNNPELATVTFYTAAIMLAGVGVFAVVKSMKLYGKVEREGVR